MTPKVKILIEQIARLRVGGIRDNVIAAKLNISQSGFSRIISLPDYKDVEQAVLHGTVSKMDEALAGRADALKEYAKQGVPVALRALLEAATQQRDLRARISAASEILDRDPDRLFAKGQVRAEENAPPVSEEMLKALDGAADKAADAVTVKERVN
jgi:hypothetical protein